MFDCDDVMCSVDVLLICILCMWLDWIVLGEVCGKEVMIFFEVINIGYGGLFIMLYVEIF